STPSTSCLRYKAIANGYSSSVLFAVGPPALIPVYSQWYIFYFAIRRKKWADLAWMISFYVRFGLCYIPFLGSLINVFVLCFRFIESDWFVWVTQMNHIPMNIDYDQNKEWLSTQNSRKSKNGLFLHFTFSPRVTISPHSLFPTMPQHNYWIVCLPLLNPAANKQFLCVATILLLLLLFITYLSI
uniref:Uncharacterized protein n=1 Tax=Xenopus tropicalis TaxID=8364 RepID=A0A6I8R860_XENTR